MGGHNAADSPVRFAESALQGGFTQVPNTILTDANLSAGARITWAVLASFAWRQSDWPGQDRLADSIGISDRTLRRYIDELKQAKLLQVVQRGLRMTNQYLLRSTPDRTQVASQDRTSTSSPFIEKTVSVSSPSRTSSNSQQLQIHHPREEDIVLVFEKWKALYGDQKTRLTQGRRTPIEARLAEGRTPEELIEALEGVEYDDWLTGRAEGSAGFTQLHTLLRDDDQVLKLIGLKRQPPGKRRTQRRRFAAERENTTVPDANGSTW